ncbi:MAG: hypothetical protein AB7E55_12830 [Pigmentiphaga sp.]
MRRTDHSLTAAPDTDTQVVTKVALLVFRLFPISLQGACTSLEAMRCYLVNTQNPEVQS